MAMAMVAALFTGSSAVAQEWPQRSITMIVAYDAGGGTDILARTVARYLEEELGTSIIVENRPGAGGQVGFTALAQANPDGYTIGFINLPPLLTIPIERTAAYSLAHLEPIANLVDDPGAFNVHVDSEFQTLDDLVAYARENPGAVTVGTSGVGSDDHLAMLAFERIAGIELTHVPFSGAAPNRAALLGRHIAVGGFNISEAMEFLEEGRIRTLGQMADERWELAPDVPTFQEQDYNVVAGSQRGLAAPAGVPEEILDRLSEAVERALNNPEFVEDARRTYLPLRYIPRQQYIEFLQEQDRVFRELWEEDPWAGGN
jgi:tripartite-type tricarboxylate transporter receptor subunit TctC